MIPRVIPSLLLKSGGLYKTEQFKNERYVGDPVNAVRIFNEKRVDELCVLDMTRARQRTEIDFALLTDIAGEAFMPLSYGGGVGSLEQIDRLIVCGFERVVVNTSAVQRPAFVDEIVRAYGTSTLIGGIDVKRDWLGRPWVTVKGATLATKLDPVDWARELEQRGVGEILLTAVDREGTFKGYDLDLVAKVASAVSVPVIAAGGAASLSDFKQATVESGAAAVSAGSMFVYHGKHRAVLISYPTQADLTSIWT